MKLNSFVKLKNIFLLVTVGFVLSCSEPSPRTFNSEIWKSKDYVARAAMVDDINSRDILENKNKFEVAKLLGEPDFKFSNNAEERWKYKIIMLPRCRFIWTCIAEVRFDKKTDKFIGEVVRYD